MALGSNLSKKGKDKSTKTSKKKTETPKVEQPAVGLGEEKKVAEVVPDSTQKEGQAAATNPVDENKEPVTENKESIDERKDLVTDGNDLS